MGTTTKVKPPTIIGSTENTRSAGTLLEAIFHPFFNRWQLSVESATP